MTKQEYLNLWWEKARYLLKVDMKKEDAILILKPTIPEFVDMITARGIERFTIKKD